MIFSNVKIKTRYIDLREANIDFSKYGIYVIEGANGSGKTTLLEGLIRQNFDAAFSTDAQRHAYLNSRYTLFSYVPQQIPAPSVSVRNFIFKPDSDEREQLRAGEMLKAFNFEEGALDKKVNVLSGGERTKLYIISALLKDTPYLFMDEPTNNLDDSSVSAFLKLLKEYATGKTFILTTHDPRLKDLPANRIRLEKGKIVGVTGSDDGKGDNDAPPNDSVTFSGREIASAFVRNKLNRTLAVILLLSLIILFVVDFLALNFNYAFSDKSLSQDTILLYQVDYAYGELNQEYCKYERLNPVEDHSRMISYDDLGKIAGEDGISTFYAIYEDKFASIYDVMDGVPEEESTIMFSIPQIVSSQFLPEIGLYDAFSLTDGRLPYDGSNEIAMSSSVLTNLGYGDAAGTLGKSISYEGKSYTLVGITVYDFVIVSYTPGDQLLFYEYQPSTYEQFKEWCLEYKKAEEFYYEDSANFVVFITGENREREVLDELIENYPADNYYSYLFDLVIAEGMNGFLVRMLLIVNCIGAFAIGILMHLLQRQQAAEDMELVHTFDIYYLNEERVKKVYRRSRILSNAAVLVIAAIIGLVLIWNFTYARMIVPAAVVIVFAVQTFFMVKKATDRRS